MPGPDIFDAIASPVRRALLDMLADGARSVHDLAAPFDMRRPAVSQHLRVLRDAGLVTEERGGRERHYRLDTSPLRAVTDWAAHYERFWQRRPAAPRSAGGGRLMASVEVDEVLPYPPGRVWQALTDPALLGRWLMPNDSKPVIGHLFTFRTEPVPQHGFDDLPSPGQRMVMGIPASRAPYGVGHLIRRLRTPCSAVAPAGASSPRARCAPPSGRAGRRRPGRTRPSVSAAGMPAIVSASTSCAAVTPEPQYTPIVTAPSRLPPGPPAGASSQAAARARRPTVRAGPTIRATRPRGTGTGHRHRHRPVNRARNAPGSRNRPSGPTFSLVGALTAAGMCPATGSTGSTSPR